MSGPVSLRAWARGFSLALLAASLAACGVFEKKEPPPGPCPRALILSDAAAMAQFRDGPGRDLLDVSYSGRVRRVYSDCFYEMKKDKTGLMKARVLIAIDAERGPANRDRTGVYRYFVALSDSKHEPISKNVFELVAAFPGNAARTTLTDDSVELTVSIQAGQSGRDFTILVGFQLTEDQLDFNRRLRQERESAR